ncbi:MAG: dienelactone hydrolase family protein [Vicingaceae bacterium]
MRKLLKIGHLAVLVILIGCGRNQKINEATTSTEEFSELSKEEGFAEKHAEPKAIASNIRGEMISIPVKDGEAAAAYQIKSEKKTKNYLFVIHEWWGLNNHIKNEANKWFEKLGNVNVLALDLYDGKVATTREEAQEYMSSVDEERIKSIIDAAIETLPLDAELATIGWCFGGGWSLRAAIQAGDKSTACVIYYGMPVKEEEQLKALNAEVLFIYGTQDEWINENVAKAFQANMKQVNKVVEILAFDADHAFANPSGGHYKEKAAKEANEKAYEFLMEKL